MAWIRLEPQQGFVGNEQQYDGICEEKADLEAEESNGYVSFDGAHIRLAVGSGAVCMEDASINFKTENGWKAATGTGSGEETTPTTPTEEST